MKKPFFDRKLLETVHGNNLDEESLLKLGQISIENYNRITLDEQITETDLLRNQSNTEVKVKKMIKL